MCSCCKFSLVTSMIFMRFSFCLHKAYKIFNRCENRFEIWGLKKLPLTKKRLFSKRRRKGGRKNFSYGGGRAELKEGKQKTFLIERKFPFLRTRKGGAFCDTKKRESLGVGRRIIAAQAGGSPLTSAPLHRDRTFLPPLRRCVSIRAYPVLSP